jgi:hypothetical protein
MAPSASGAERTDFNPTEATIHLWAEQPIQVKNILKESAQKNKPWLLDGTYRGMPLYAMAIIPEATPIYMPSKALPKALSHKVIKLQTMNVELPKRPTRKGLIVVSTVTIAIAATSTYFIWKML